MAESVPTHPTDDPHSPVNNPRHRQGSIDECNAADVAAAFRAHTSPAFEAAALLAADTPEGGTQSYLATCEKVPTSDKEKAENRPEEYELVEQVTDAREALQSCIGRSRERERTVLALIDAGEVAHAKRVAQCCRKSVQLECGHCESGENYVPMHCDSRLCPECSKRQMGLKAEKYRPAVESFEHPTMMRLSLPNRVEPERLQTAIDALRGAFGRLRRRVIPPEGESVVEDDDGGTHRKRWVWADDGGEPADFYWKARLLQAGERRLAKRLEMKYVKQGKGIPFEEIVPSGVYGIDAKQGEDGTLNVHAHVIADCAFLPQAALASEWAEITNAPAVDIRRVQERGEQGAESALMEVVGYAAKPPEFQTKEQEVEYLTALKGSNLIQPFGELHGNTPAAEGILRCTDCEEAPAEWFYLGVVDERVSTAQAGAAPDGDRPPPAAPGSPGGERNE